MSATIEITQKINFRRYKDGDSKHVPWNKHIFQAGYTYKCPTYIQSTPPCQGQCPAGEDIRGYLNIVRGNAPLPRTSTRSSVNRPPPPPQQKVCSCVVPGAISTK